ncbi:MAG TPA: sensor histidine kinase [Rhizobacter sp.]|nr:sensor histidine kinase [Rhizobacter sp.]
MVAPAPLPPQAPATPPTFFGSVKLGFAAYSRWLASISWFRFFLIAVLTLIVSGVLSSLPPFNIPWGRDTIIYKPKRVPTPPQPPAPPAEPGNEKTAVDIGGKSYTITVGKDGIRIGPTGASAPAPLPSASGAGVHVDLPGVKVDLPEGASNPEVREAIREAKAAIEEALADAREAAAEAADAAPSGMREIRISAFTPGEHLPGFAFLLIVISGIIKLMAAGRFKAEARAVVATEMAESEALKRQVVEARMAAMQAQVEPHFLFNTLASIDHLIETDPPRASKMQKNLIALLRASMPTMREANAQSNRDLGRELAVIRPYLEILKVRMEDRLTTDIRVSDGLLSAEFPPMMLQSLVENAIKHGLEPKPEGGSLTVSAEIVHGKLAVTVADTGLGFGKAATAGTGIGLANIRERLQLLYGSKASLTVAENPGGGTAVTITVPYSSNNHEGKA